MDLTFTALDDSEDGTAWRSLFDRLWPDYRRWYLQEGVERRPTYLECRRAMKAHMPAFLPEWARLCDLVGGGDLEARFLSLYCPPAYLSGCSQGVWPGAEPLLVRNYDYAPQAFDAVILRTSWQGQTVLGTADCLSGLVDGMNEAGLCLSLTFGGRRVVGEGFGVPIILRHVLQQAETAEEAGRMLASIPTHMAYNVTALDAKRRYVTVMMSPDRRAIVTKQPVATNHQEQVEWIAHARETASVERERYLLQRLTLHQETQAKFIGAFLRPPLYSLAFDRGFGTLYTAAYFPRKGMVSYRWPNEEWTLSLQQFKGGMRVLRYPLAAAG